MHHHDSPPSPLAASQENVTVVELPGMVPDGPPYGDVTPPGCGASIRPLSAYSRLVDAFLDTAASRGGHAAIIRPGETYCYRSIAQVAAGVAQFLKCRTLPPGARVALLLENGPEYVAAFYGALLAGGVVVPLPPDVEAGRLRDVLRACEAKFVLAESNVLLRRPALGLKVSEAIEYASSPEPRAAPPPLRINGQSLAMILFTSGSCGDPKGVMLSDENLLANADSILGYLPLRPDDRTLAVLPFYHAYGNSILQTHIVAGATIVIDGSPAFPNSIVDALREHHITSFSAVPEVYHSLLSYSDLVNASLPQLRYATVAGGALGPARIVELAKGVAPAEFYVMYGQSEATARLSYLPPEYVSSHSRSIGKAIPGVELKIMDKSGELCARGRNIMLGYWNDPAATAQAIQDGWLHTGDLATMDEDGFIYISGRKSQLVKIQGVRVHPREIERIVAARFPGARAVVVPFRQNAAMRLALYLVPSANHAVSAEQVRRDCLRQLPRAQSPAYVEILQSVPLNASLKVDRRALTKRAESQHRAAG